MGAGGGVAQVQGERLRHMYDGMCTDGSVCEKRASGTEVYGSSAELSERRAHRHTHRTRFRASSVSHTLADRRRRRYCNYAAIDTACVGVRETARGRTRSTLLGRELQLYGRETRETPALPRAGAVPLPRGVCAHGPPTAHRPRRPG